MTGGPDRAGGVQPADRPSPSILHVDLDAFFAAVEQLEDPALRGRPVMVGGLGGRGVVAAASYEARRYGVRSAMPTATARRLCPEGVFVAPRHDRYSDYSRRVFAVLRDFTHLVEGVSVDEAFLDVAGAGRLFGDGESVATRIRERVREEIGLTCSVGVATTKLVAKLASEEAKPDGLLVVAAGEERAFLDPLPVERLWGVGPATAEKLHELGIRTIAELASAPAPTLVRRLGAAAGAHLHALAHNDDRRAVSPDREVKSVSAEETFPSDVTDPDALGVELRRLSARVAARLRRAGLTGRTVTVKARWGDFTTVTRSKTLAAPVDGDREVAVAAAEAFSSLEIGDGFRLVGVGVSNLEPRGPVQEALPFGGEVGRVDDVVDEVRDRFGTDALRRG